MKRIFYWAFILFIFLIPVFQYLSVRILVVLFILSLLLNFKFRFIQTVIVRNWDLLLYIVILLIGLIYSENQLQALKILETSFCFLAIPFVYSEFQKRNTDSNVPISIFSFGVLMACCISIIYATIQYSRTSNPTVFFYYQLTQLVGIQPTYLAYYVIFVVTSYTFRKYYETSGTPFFVFSIVVFFLFVFLFLTGGKTAFISMILSLSFFALKFLLDNRSPERTYTIIVISVILIGFIFLSTSPNFEEIVTENTDYWERSLLWKSAIDANPNPLLGVGTGDYKSVLDQYYLDQGMTQYAEDSYNSHNQFIQIYFSNGILGLITLFLIIGRPLYMSFKIQNSLGILIIFPFIIYGVTEVYLGRYQGVVFFVLCHQIVISQYYSTKSKFSFTSA